LNSSRSGRAWAPLSSNIPDPDFFFSSRRRHTRCYRDWSSDVCSSDLIVTEQRTIGSIANLINYSYNLDDSIASVTYPHASGQTRSEERRVGKESRAQGPRRQCQDS